MLMLSRRRRERVLVEMPGGNGPVRVWVEVVDVLPNGTVRLGFAADRSVTIRREELLPAAEAR